MPPWHCCTNPQQNPISGRAPTGPARNSHLPWYPPRTHSLAPRASWASTLSPLRQPTHPSTQQVPPHAPAAAHPTNFCRSPAASPGALPVTPYLCLSWVLCCAPSGSCPVVSCGSPCSSPPEDHAANMRKHKRRQQQQQRQKQQEQQRGRQPAEERKTVSLCWC